MTSSDMTRRNPAWDEYGDDEVPLREFMHRMTWDMQRKIDSSFGRLEDQPDAE